MNASVLAAERCSRFNWTSLMVLRPVLDLQEGHEEGVLIVVHRVRRVVDTG